MEPLSTLLTSYLFSISSEIQNDYRANVGLDITPVSISYKNTDVHFQHQLWRIKSDSVCISYKQDSSRYSQCTINAKSLFGEICIELSSTNNKNHIHQKHQNMYCNASLSYQPMIATIASPAKSKLDEQAKKCNQLILQAMGSKDKELIEKRNQACKSASN